MRYTERSVHAAPGLRITAVCMCAMLLFVGCAWAEAPVTQILIGNGGSPKPYSYLDEDNNLTGYEIELVSALDELLPQYEFKFEQTEFTSIFAGIDSGRYQMGTNNFTKKPEREEKYLFANEYFVYNYTIAVVKKDRADIKTLEDLAGKKTYVGDGGGFAQIFYDSFNAQHPDNPVDTIYSGADTLKVFQDIDAGVIDFTFMETVMLDNYFKEFPELEPLLDPVYFSQEDTQAIQDPYAWFIFPKTEAGEKLRDDVDAALLQLVENGTLVELSQKYFGFDATGR